MKEDAQDEIHVSWFMMPSTMCTLILTQSTMLSCYTYPAKACFSPLSVSESLRVAEWNISG